jgi:hypothetical protein
MPGEFEERIRLTVVDDSKPATDNANRNLQSVENQAVKSTAAVSSAVNSQVSKVVTITQQSQSAINRIVAQAERNAAFAKTAGDPLARLSLQFEQNMKRVAGDEQAVRRLTQAYQEHVAAIRAVTEAKRRDAAAGPVQQVGEILGGLTRGVTGGVGGILGGVVAGGAAAGLATAGFSALVGTVKEVSTSFYEAAKSLSEVGLRTRDVELRTGLAAREVGAFGFAARAEGQDVSVFERAMRGLTQAEEDLGPGGEKARAAIQRMGVSLRDLHGQLRPTADVLLDISEGLSRLPAGAERDKAALDIFRRSGIELIPTMQALSENVKYFYDHGLPSPTQEQIDRWAEYGKAIAQTQLYFEHLKQEILGPLAEAFNWLATHPVMQGALPKELEQRITDAATHPGGPSRGKTLIESLGLIPEEAAQRAAATQLGEYLKGGLEGARAELERLQKVYDETRKAADDMAKSGALLPEVARQQEQSVNQARIAYEQQDERVKLLQKDEAARIQNLEKIRDLIKEGVNFYALLDRKQTIISESELIRAAPRRPPTLLRPGEAGVNPAAEAAAAAYGVAPLQGGLQRFAEGLMFVSPEAERTLNLAGASMESFKADLDAFGSAQKRSDQEHLAALKSEEQFRIRMIELQSGPGGELDTAQKVAAIQQEAAQKEFAITGDISKLREATLQSEMELRLKIAEAEKREVEQLYETIRSNVSNVIDHIFSKTRDFLTSLKNAARNLFLKPLEDMLSTRLSAAITGGLTGTTPEFPAAAGGTRFQQLFGFLGAQPGFRSKSDQPGHLGDLLLYNGNVPVVVMNPYAGTTPLAPGAPTALTGGFQSNIFNIGAGSAPAIAAAALPSLARAAAAGAGVTTSTMTFPSVTGGAETITVPPQIFGGIGGLGFPGATTPPFAGGSIPGISGAGAAGGGIGGIGGGGGLPGVLSQLGGGGVGGTVGLLGGLGLLGSMIGLRGAFSLGQGALGLPGKIGAPLIGAASGLLGFGALSTFFPALVAAGPIGWIAAAGIGAAVGLAGLLDPSKTKQIHDLVKQIYNVDIRNQGVLNQLNQLATQSFGGSIHTMIYSQQARQLIQLYALSTGQNARGIVATPVASQFSNAPGGQLSAVPSYFNGQPVYPGQLQSTVGYSYLNPVYNPSSGNYLLTQPVVGANVVTQPAAHISLSLDGPSTQALLTGGAVQAINDNPRLVSVATISGQDASAGRRDAAVNVLQPNFVVS